MSKSNAAEHAFVLLVFNNTNFALIGDATGLRGSSVAGSLYVSLHTADPGEGGDQTTNEASYTSYTRVAVARTAGGWTVTGPSAANTGATTFPTCSGGSPQTITHVGIGTDPTGAGVLLYSGATGPASVGTGVTPNYAAGALVATED